VLDALSGIAPVHAVRGNVDGDSAGLRDSLHLQLDGVQIHLSHGHELGSPTPAALAARYQADVIVYGHTHRALVTHVGRTLMINPGAAGPPRFNLKPSVGLLTLPSLETRIVLV
jgi:putative phosphoesterase